MGTPGSSQPPHKPTTPKDISEAVGWGVLKAVIIIVAVLALVPLFRNSMAEYRKYAPAQPPKPDYQQLERDAAREAQMEEARRYRAQDKQKREAEAARSRSQ